MRLKIISAVCNGERNVSDLLAQIDTTQSNMSQRLATLYRAGVLGRRREGAKANRSTTACRASALLRCAGPSARRWPWSWSRATSCQRPTGCSAPSCAEVSTQLPAGPHSTLNTQHSAGGPIESKAETPAAT